MNKTRQQLEISMINKHKAEIELIYIFSVIEPEFLTEFVKEHCFSFVNCTRECLITLRKNILPLGTDGKRKNNQV